MPQITVTCPKCGNPIVVDCDYTNGSSTATARCGRCSKQVSVNYYNGCDGFRVRSVQ